MPNGIFDPFVTQKSDIFDPFGQPKYMATSVPAPETGEVFDPFVKTNPYLPQPTATDPKLIPARPLTPVTSSRIPQVLPSRSIFTDIPASVAQGVVDVGQMTGEIGQTLGIPGAERFARGAENLAKETPFLTPSKETSEGFIRGSLTGGIRSILPSVAFSAPLGLLGSKVAQMVSLGSKATPIGAAIGLAAGGLPFGLAEYSRFRNEAKDAGIDPDSVRGQALLSALIEGGVEGIANFIGARILLGGMANGPIQAFKDVLKRPFKSYLKAYLKDLPFELSTEGTQNYLEAKLRQDVGIPTETPWESFKAAMGPTTVMTVLFSLGSAGFHRRVRKQVEGYLSNPETPQDQREWAANVIAGNLEEANRPELAIFWLHSAKEKIQNNEAIDLDKPIADWLDKVETSPGTGIITPPTGEIIPPVITAKGAGVVEEPGILPGREQIATGELPKIGQEVLEDGRSARYNEEINNYEKEKSPNLLSKVWVIAQRLKGKTKNDAEIGILIRARKNLRDAETEGYGIVDLEGKHYDTGMALKVVAFEPTEGITEETIGEVIKPTIIKDGKLVQTGEVVVFTPITQAPKQAPIIEPGVTPAGAPSTGITSALEPSLSPSGPVIPLPPKPFLGPVVENTTPVVESTTPALVTSGAPKPPVEPGVEPGTAGTPMASIPEYKGKDTQIATTEGSDPAHYAFVEADRIIPSHDVLRGFAKHPQYPAGVQERPYHLDRNEQLKVLQRTGESFDPRFLVSDNPDAINGPPIIRPNGVVLGGNSRAMILNHIYANNPQNASRYRQILAEISNNFNLNPEHLQAMQKPILVRVLDTPVSEQDLARKARVYNQPFTQGLNRDAEGISKAKMVSQATMEKLSAGLEQYDTINQYLFSGSSNEIVSSLISDGVIDRNQINAYVNKENGLLNPEGRKMVERMIRGKIIDDFGLIDSTEPSIMNKIDKALPALTKLQTRGEEWDIADVLKDALREYNKFKSSGETKLKNYLNPQQLGMLGVRPPSMSPEVKRMLIALAGMKPTEFRDALNKLSDTASMDLRGQPTLGIVEKKTFPEAYDGLFPDTIPTPAMKGEVRKPKTKTAPPSEGGKAAPVAAPSPTKFEINDIVDPTPESGLNSTWRGVVTNVEERADGQYIGVKGRALYPASYFTLVSKARPGVGPAPPTKYKVGEKVLVEYGQDNRTYPAMIIAASGKYYTVEPSLTVARAAELNLGTRMSVMEENIKPFQEEKVPEAPTAPAKGFAAEIKAEGKWGQRNNMVFGTSKEAESYASDLLSRWMGAQDSRIIEVDEAPTWRWTANGLEKIEEAAPAPAAPTPPETTAGLPEGWTLSTFDTTDMRRNSVFMDQETARRLSKSMGHKVWEDSFQINQFFWEDQGGFKKIVPSDQVTRTQDKILADIANGTFILAEDQNENVHIIPNPNQAVESNLTQIQDFSLALRDEIRNRILTGDKGITNTELMTMGAGFFGGTRAEGKFTPRQAYDALEMAVNKYMIDNPRIVTAEGLKSLERIMPTQVMRTEEVQKFQQFSTPPRISYATNWLANLNQGDIYLETSARNGGLAVFAKVAGVKGMILNELSKDCVDNLKFLFPEAQVFNENAEHANAIIGVKLKPEEKPTVAVINPPFSTSGERMPGKKLLNIVEKHIEEAMSMLQPNGRLVVITGRGFTLGAPTFKDFWKKIQGQYNVKANIGLSGKNYAKYGTTFDIRITVIDKAGKTTGEIYEKFYNNIEEILSDSRLEGIRNERIAIEGAVAGKPKAGEPVIETGATEGKPGAKFAELVLGPVGGVGVGEGTKPVLAQPGLPVRNMAENLGIPAEGPTVLAGEKSGESGGPGRIGTGGGSVTGGVGGEVHGRGGVESKGIIPGLPQPAHGELTNSVFEFIPETLHTVDGQATPAHPADIVESAVHSDVSLPDLSKVQLHLKKENLGTATKISGHQITMVKLAVNAFSRGLGFFNAGGTGFGKGLVNAAIALNSFNSGQKKAVWISQNHSLMLATQRDWQDLGGKKDDILDFSKVKNNESIETRLSNKGVLYLTYALLREKVSPEEATKGKKNRLDQVTEWLGKDFDGVLIFDESHNMANGITVDTGFGKSKGSQTFKAGFDIQNLLPNAKIVYSSATGATELANLAYATRLGLWGENGYFPTIKDFLQQVAPWGIGGLEQVSADMKRKGVYWAPSLAFQGKTPEKTVTYEKLTQVLTPQQRDIHNNIAKLWQKVLHWRDEAMISTGANEAPGMRASQNSAFWGNQLRFFQMMSMSMQMPIVFQQADKDIAEGKAVILQLVNTGKASQDRSEARLTEEQELEELDLSPRDILLRYLEEYFPIHKYEIKTDQETGEDYAVLVKDSQGNPVEDPEAVAKKNQLLAELGSVDLPTNPLDLIIEHFGPDAVTEITGRDKRFVKKDGKVVEEKRNDRVIAKELQEYRDDKRKILVFSGKGGTGESYDADYRIQNQRRRMHYLVQAGYSATKVFQGVGRSHRSSQVVAPHYYPVTTDMKAQMRFSSSIAKKLEMLGGLSKGQRQTTSEGLFSARDNLENTQAYESLGRFFGDLAQGKVEGISINEYEYQTGLKLRDKDGHLKASLPAMNQFLNRLLSMELDVQNIVFDHFSSILDRVITEAERQGRLDLGLQNLRALKVEIVSEKNVFSDPSTGAKTQYLKIESTHESRIFNYNQVLTWAESGVYRNVRSQAIWAAGKPYNHTGKDGSVSRVVPLRSPNYTSEYIPLNEFNDAKKWTRVPAEQSKTQWEEGVEKAPKTFKRNKHIISGAILPIWTRLSPDGGLIRFQTPDGRRVIGKEIMNKDLAATLQNLHAEDDTAMSLTPQGIYEHVMSLNKVVRLANNWRFRRSKTMGEERLEIVGPNQEFNDWLKTIGVNMEYLNFKTRYFIPVNPVHAAEIIERITKTRPVSAVEDRSGNNIFGSLGELISNEGIASVSGVEYVGIQKIPNHPDQYVFNETKTGSTFYTFATDADTLMRARDRIRLAFEKAKLPSLSSIGDAGTEMRGWQSVVGGGRLTTELTQDWKENLFDVNKYKANKAVQFLAKNSPVLEDRTLFQALLANEKVVAKLQQLPVAILDTSQTVWAGLRAYYSGDDHRIVIDKDVFSLSNQERLSGTILEEVVHGLAHHSMTAQDKHALQAMLNKAISSLPEKERSEARKSHKTYEHSYLKMAGLTSQGRAVYYGLQNIDEFLASPIRYPEMREFLKSIPEVEGIARPTNLWDRFTQWMSRVIFGDVNQASLLRQVLEKAGELIERPMEAQLSEADHANRFYSIDDAPLPLPIQDGIDGMTNTQMAHAAAADPGFIAWVKQRMGILNITNGDLGTVEQYLSLPYYLGKKYPAFRKILDRQILRETDRSKYSQQYLTMAKPFMMLKGGQYENVEKALIQGDRDRAVYDEPTLRERFGLDSTGVEAYASARMTLDSMLQRWLDHAEYALLRPFEKRLSNEEYLKLLEIYKQKLSPEEIAALPKKVAVAYVKLRPGVNIVQRVRGRVAELKGYFPRWREPGKYYVTVKKQNEEGLPEETIFTTFAKTEWEATNIVNDLKANAEPNEKVYYGVHTQENESTFFGVSDTNLQRLIDNAISTVKKEGALDPDLAINLRGALSVAVAESLMQRGAGARMMKRSKHIIEGYATTGLQQVLKNYIVGYIGMETKQDAAYDFMEGLSEVPKNHPTLFQESSHYIESMLRNYDRQDKFFAKFRSLAFIYYLAGSIRGAAVQFTQNFVTGIPFLAREMKGMGWFGAERAYTKAMWDIALGKMTEEERVMDHELLMDGVSNDQMIRSISREIHGTTAEATGKVFDILSYPFSKMEIFNRRSAVLATYRVYTAKGFGYEETKAKIANFIWDTHYLMTKANLPHAARGGDIPSKLIGTAYTFRRFSHHYILSMIHSMRGPDGKFSWKNMDVFVRSLAWMAVFGGLAGLPFLDDLLDELEKLFGTPFRTQIRKELTSLGGEPLERMGINGIPALLGQIPGMVGVDLSGSLRIGLPSITEPGRGAQEAVFGVWGGLSKKMLNSWDSVGREDYLRAVEFASPAFIENVLKSVRMTTIGATTPHGNAMGDVKGQPIKETTGEAIAQAMGFRPERISGMAKTYREFSNIERKFDGRRERLNDLFRLAKTNDERQEIIRDVQKYNMDAQKYRGAIPMINATSLRRSYVTKPDKHYLAFGAQIQ